MADESLKNDAGWQDKLTAEEYRICRGKGTERPFTGEYNDCKTAGTYHCKCCGEPLFTSGTKYDSGSGWPSFYAPVEAGKVDEHRDQSMAMERTEIVCARCECHLGHVFPDGPAPTGLRYCVNSASLDLRPDDSDQS